MDGTPLGFPVLIANGARPGPVLLIDGGIHGDEQEGTLAVAEFVRELDPNALTGAVVAVPLMNVGAFEAMARGNPRDTHSHDMNRIYPGNATGYLTDRIAATHAETAAAVADIEITFHSGGNICYLGEAIFTTSDDPLGLELAQAMGPDWTIVLDTPHPAGSPMAAMTPAGKPAITVELGGGAGTMPGTVPCERGHPETRHRQCLPALRHARRRSQLRAAPLAGASERGAGECERDPQPSGRAGGGPPEATHPRRANAAPDL